MHITAKLVKSLYNTSSFSLGSLFKTPRLNERAKRQQWSRLSLTATSWLLAEPMRSMGRYDFSIFNKHSMMMRDPPWSCTFKCILSGKSIVGDSSILLRSKYLQRDTSTKMKFLELFSISLHQVAAFPWLYILYSNITVKCSTIKKIWHKHYRFCRSSRCRYLDHRSIKQTPYRCSKKYVPHHLGGSILRNYNAFHLNTKKLFALFIYIKSQARSKVVKLYHGLI